ncbi:hypothetical protein [Saccharothrix variisporea]|uniref:Uncharacterized protein n=1 Tax=Saccharothrix variisporea TaxID=543527 RepID=A0A495XFJ4_9PSEU|nr:hypothetical protein [Saccharothrix variisporea]RKT71905.1 hypothetical protein DFJ66_5207 [Saccharothrix variisporea]
MTATLSDLDLLALLADLLDRIDPVPEFVVRQAEAALVTSTGAVLARLITDSAHTAPAPTTRTLRFTALDVVLEPALGGLHATGFARTGTTLHTHWPTGSLATPLGPGGFFHVDHVPSGPLKFVLRQEGAPDTATRWFVS